MSQVIISHEQGYRWMIKVSVWKLMTGIITDSIYGDLDQQLLKITKDAEKGKVKR